MRHASTDAGNDKTGQSSVCRWLGDPQRVEIDAGKFG